MSVTHKYVNSDRKYSELNDKEFAERKRLVKRGNELIKLAVIGRGGREYVDDVAYSSLESRVCINANWKKYFVDDLDPRFKAPSSLGINTEQWYLEPLREIVKRGNHDVVLAKRHHESPADVIAHDEAFNFSD